MLERQSRQHPGKGVLNSRLLADNAVSLVLVGILDARHDTERIQSYPGLR